MSHVSLAFFNVLLTFLKLLFASFYIRAINQLHGCECDCTQEVKSTWLCTERTKHSRTRNTLCLGGHKSHVTQSDRQADRRAIGQNTWRHVHLYTQRARRVFKGYGDTPPSKRSEKIINWKCRTQLWYLTITTGLYYFFFCIFLLNVFVNKYIPWA